MLTNFHGVESHPAGNLYNMVELPKLSGLKIAHLNVQIIWTRQIMSSLLFITDVYIFTFNNIFTFSGTWLKPSIKDLELNIPGYTLVRDDRTGKRGSGTAMYVCNNIPYKHRPDFLAKNIKSSWVKVNRLTCKRLFVGCVYRPPNACSTTFIDLLNNSLSKLPTGSQIVRLGDFNIVF